MAGTFPFSLTTLAVGIHPLGQITLVNADAAVVLNIDRTVVNGLNSQPVSTNIHLEVDLSEDGGATWWQIMASDTPGGIFTHRGITINTSYVSTQLPDVGQPRMARAVATVTGASVAVAGNLTIS